MRAYSTSQLHKSTAPTHLQARAELSMLKASQLTVSTMQRIRLLLALAAACLFANLSQAAGLGNTELKSHLGEPLLLEIPLLINAHDDIEQLHFGIAPQAVYQQMQVERSPGHNSLNFRIDNSRGKAVLFITSHNPVHEPYLHFVLEMRSPSGVLYKDIPLLLDTPTIDEKSPPIHDPGQPGRQGNAILLQP